MSKFDSGRFSGTRGSRDDGFRKVNGFTTRVHEGRQGKHIIGHNNYQKGKSVLHMTMARAQELIETHGGTGSWINGSNRERVDFGFEIGTYVGRDGSRQATTIGNIHYSNSGSHIVPARPKEEQQ
uniref:Transposase n=1 Tax=Muribaculaceae bacterium Z82 TaxID=2304548 RepID=A0A7C9JJ75_9BACT